MKPQTTLLVKKMILPGTHFSIFIIHYKYSRKVYKDFEKKRSMNIEIDFLSFSLVWFSLGFDVGLVQNHKR